MILKPGQYIKILFRTGISVEGTVKQWDDDDCVILSADKKSFLFIPHAQDDIMVIQVVIDRPTTDIVENIKKYKDNESDEDLKLKTLGELYKDKIEQDRKIVKDKLKDHNIENVRRVEYGLPGFFSKPNSK